MTNEDIIRMAREAGWTQEYLEFGDVRLERFATIVAAAEREACAKVCEAFDNNVAAAIRARGEA